jgi:NO-binding membrane sensor protein with MHYT domain
MEHSHNILLLIASLAIALMAGFTGLSLTQGASAMGIAHRKIVVSMSAVALGSGIWSMHFVAMLGMTLPVPFHYNALITMISALVAILLTGGALLLVHFGKRTPRRIVLAGICAGLGIVAMHYIGMSGIREVKPVYSIFGIILAIAASLALCVTSFWISYGHRGSRNILLATAVFGTSVVAVHFTAMASTHFVEADFRTTTGLWLSNEVLAFGVTLSSFVISGAFLLAGATFASDMASVQPMEPTKQPPEKPAPPKTLAPATPVSVTIPYEKDGQNRFVPSDEVAAIRAEGRYTVVYHPLGKLFCPWSISSAEQRLVNTAFVKCHRSYLINPDLVERFERKKDNGLCLFDGSAHLEKVPVSRSYLKKVRDSLGL